jgi:tripeptide aminopeptidase
MARTSPIRNRSAGNGQADLLKIDESAALKRVMRLMAIPGRSGREEKIVAAIRAELKENGIGAASLVTDHAHRRSPLGGGAGNLILKLPGTIRGPRRLLMAHVDTVPLCEGSRPVRRGDRIVSANRESGLGADDRAGACVLLQTVAEIHRRRLEHPPLTFLWLVQEEVGLLGARHADLKKLGGPKLCFNWDGGAADVAVCGATGGTEIRVEVHGLASHAGAHPEQGISAIGIAGMAIAELVRGGWHGLVTKGDSRGTSNIGVVTAGEATNVVTPRLTLRAEARSHDPRFRQQIIEAFRAAFENAAATVKNAAGATGRVQFDVLPKYDSFRIQDDDHSVRAAVKAIERVGLRPSTRISNGGLDANWMTARGLPSVTLGCGQQDVHTVDESLDIKNYLAACRIALLLATGAV